MLLIETEIRKSDIHGMGLFCKTLIPKGTKVWEFHPLFDITINETELVNLPEPALVFLKMYGYRSVETSEFIVNLDASRHMNHSENPSLFSDASSSYFAAYDLLAGTELTCDYREFSSAGCSDF